jgi:transposase
MRYNGEPLRVTFALDCCGREAMSSRRTRGRRLRQERTAHSNRIRSLLVLHNLRVERIRWAQHDA